MHLGFEDIRKADIQTKDIHMNIMQKVNDTYQQNTAGVYMAREASITSFIK